MNYLFFQDGWSVIQNDGVPPENALELSNLQLEEINNALSERKKIIQTENGYSILDRSIEDYWSEFRSKRNSLLLSTDWTQVEDAPVNKGEWRNYRQQLRDLPENTEDPLNPIWPTPPQ